MNTTVTATNMHVRAVAEDGLLINEVNTASSTTWDNEATANQASSSASLLYPASTADGSTWYHAKSTKSNTSASATSGTESPDLNGGYETLIGLVNITAMSTSASPGINALRETKGKTATDAAGYYVHYTYYLKGASGTATALAKTAGAQNVQITKVEATTTTSYSAALNPSLRVGIKLNSEFYIYAPVATFTGTYYVAADTTATEPFAGNTATYTDLASLPAAGSNGVPVEVYIWYEGEDAGCKSDNATAATLDDIDVDITFSLVTVS